MIKNSPIPSWEAINWKQIDNTVKNIRSEIFLATRQGDVLKLRYLQKRMLLSKSNLLLAIKHVTSTNDGKKTPGIDKEIYLNPRDRFLLYQIKNYVS